MDSVVAYDLPGHYNADPNHHIYQAPCYIPSTVASRPRALPSVPILPSTPSVSRPGSATPCGPTKDLCIKAEPWEPVTPPGSAASPWEHLELNTEGPLTPSSNLISMLTPSTEQMGSEYFPQVHPISSSTTSPTSPSSDCINPQALCNPSNFVGQGQLYALSAQDYTSQFPEGYDSSVSFSGTPTTFPFETIPSAIPTTCSTPSLLCIPQSPEVKVEEILSLGTKRSHSPDSDISEGSDSSSVSISSQSSYSSEEPAPKRQKKQSKSRKSTMDSDKASRSSSVEHSQPEESGNDSPVDGASPQQSQSASDVEQAVADGNVIPGPPPQNRRGRKQSVTKDPSKPFGCPICDRWFRRQEHLKRHHKSIHTEEKPHKCNECGKTFSRSDNLTQHQRTHGSGSVSLDVMTPQQMHEMRQHMEANRFNQQALMNAGDVEENGMFLFQMSSEIGGSGDELEFQNSSPTHPYGQLAGNGPGVL